MVVVVVGASFLRLVVPVLGFGVGESAKWPVHFTLGATTALTINGTRGEVNKNTKIVGIYNKHLGK